MELSFILNQFPDFQKWVKDKKLSPKELEILTEFQKPKTFEPLLEWIAQQRPSHSEGVQILDLGGEWLLMGHGVEPSLLKEKKASLLIKGLKKLRQAEINGRDEKRAKIARRLSASSSIKIQWIRQNDRAGLFVQFHSFSLRELKQKIQQLHSIAKKTSEGPEKLWRD